MRSRSLKQTPAASAVTQTLMILSGNLQPPDSSLLAEEMTRGDVQGTLG